MSFPGDVTVAGAKAVDDNGAAQSGDERATVGRQRATTPTEKERRGPGFAGGSLPLLEAAGLDLDEPEEQDE